MLDSLVKIAAVTPHIRVADPLYNAKECVKSAVRAYENGAHLLCFPTLSISSVTADDLFLQTAFIEECERAAELYLKETAELDIISFIGVPIRYFGKLYNAVLTIHKGVILGVTFKDCVSGEEERYFAPPPKERVTLSYAGQLTDASESLIFSCEDLPRVKISVCFADSLLCGSAKISKAARSGASLIVCVGSLCERLGAFERVSCVLKAESIINKCAIVSSFPSVFESTTDFVYSGRAYSFMLGETLNEKCAFSKDEILYSTVDFEAIEHDRTADSHFSCEASQDFVYVPYRTELKRTQIDFVNPTPFIIKDEGEREKTSALILKMQSNALARRFIAARARSMVIGVSGGLDSTLALLVCAGACDVLGIERSNIIAVTMPCFGTTKRTKNNAVELSHALGATLRTVDIKKSVLQHFKDISHSPDNYNVVYENAQARERTQVLMDIANALSGIVVGTGDLSELALGFATYNGDHMSNYGVNAGVPKTQLRSLVEYAIKGADKKLAGVLSDILKTPVSPELLPPSDGEITQCTEGIVGPYELHDFFLYYILRYGYSPRKIKRLALSAFSGVYGEREIDGWLRLFIKRFVTQQFKRSALPDGVALGEISLSPREGLKMPSDAYFDFFIRSLDGEN